MRFPLLGVAAATILALVNVSLAEPYGEIERLDPRFDELIGPDAQMEKLAEGFDWAEGPVWVKDRGMAAATEVNGGGFLLFSDIPPNRVMKWSEKDGLSIFLDESGYFGPRGYSKEPGSNGLLIDPQGRLVLCEHGNRRIGRLEEMKPDGERVGLAERYDGKRFNSPNDGVFKSNGDLYFTDPPYGLPQQEGPPRELDFCGVYRLTPEGEVTLLTDQIHRPNGIAFSPDEQTLYVAQSDGANPVWFAFGVRADGTIDEGRVFADSRDWAEPGRNLPGSQDGLKVDQHGNLFATGPGGVCVISPEGELLGRLLTGVPTANCGWGDDGATLYITADMYLLRIKTKTKGLGW